MDKKLVDRINELARKAKTPGGLTAEETLERAELRGKYLAAIRCDVEWQLGGVSIVGEDGVARPVRKRGDDGSRNGKPEAQ